MTDHELSSFLQLRTSDFPQWSNKSLAYSRLLLELSHSANATQDFSADVLRGLSGKPKWLNPTYFYDAEGSLLFERISRVPEYYVTRIEHRILRQYANDIAAYSLGDMGLVEFGSGSSIKTRPLIKALITHQSTLRYTPIDISAAMLVQSAKRLLIEYPQLSIHALVAEYREGLSRLAGDSRQKLIVFLGSSLGNFDPVEALEFMSGVRRFMADQDYFLIGNDLVKDESVLVAAYNDASGITAAFNLNILRRINRELGGTFDIPAFDHLAFLNEARGRIEMHLRCRSRQEVQVKILNTSFHFDQGETVHTENSYKYTVAQLDAMFGESGFRVVNRWLDHRNWFSLSLLRVS